MAENQMKPSYRQLLFSNGGHTRAYEGPFNRGQDTRLHPIIPQGTQRHTRACEGPFIPKAQGETLGKPLRSAFGNRVDY